MSSNLLYCNNRFLNFPLLLLIRSSLNYILEERKKSSSICWSLRVLDLIKTVNHLAGSQNSFTLSRNNVIYSFFDIIRQFINKILYLKYIPKKYFSYFNKLLIKIILVLFKIYDIKCNHKKYTNQIFTKKNKHLNTLLNKNPQIHQNILTSKKIYETRRNISPKKRYILKNRPCKILKKL